MYSIAEAAEVLGLQKPQLARWVARGRIPSAVRVEGPRGAVWRLPIETVNAVARQMHRSEQATPSEPMTNLAREAAPVRTAADVPPPIPAEIPAEIPAVPKAPLPPVAKHDPQIRWSRVEAIIARERDHWQRLSEMQADTIASLRNELETVHDELGHLRERFADFDEGAAENALLGRNTLPMQRATPDEMGDLVQLAFPRLEMP